MARSERQAFSRSGLSPFKVAYRPARRNHCSQGTLSLLETSSLVERPIGAGFRQWKVREDCRKHVVDHNKQLDLKKVHIIYLSSTNPDYHQLNIGTSIIHVFYNTF